MEALSACSDLLVKFGGHELAAGLTIKRSNLAQFKKKLNECAAQSFKGEEHLPTIEAECELGEADITMEQAAELNCLEPFGVSNPVPIFVVYRVTIAEMSLVGGGKHTRIMLKIGNKTVNAMFFRHSIDDIGLFPGDTVDVMFSLDINEFQNQKSLQMLIKDIRLSESEFSAEMNERELFKKIRNGVSRDEAKLMKSADIVPTHGDFAAVYNVIRREAKIEHEVFSIRALMNLLSSIGDKIGYVKLRFIMLVFEELNLLEIKELDAEHEVYAFKVIKTKTKTDLDSSPVLRKLKYDFAVID